MASVDAERTTGTSAAAAPLRRILIVGAVALAMDQLTKALAVAVLADPPRTVDVFWTLRFKLLYNRGTAFSLTDDSGPIVTVIALVVVVWLLRSGRRQHDRWTQVSFGLVIGGTVGNVIDRAFRAGDGFLRGGVDFIDFQWFPVFNVADAALVIGIGILFLVGFSSDDGQAEPAPGGESR